MRRRRYRCARREFIMNLPGGKKILWSGFRYPPKGHSPCTDDRIIDFIESKPAFKAGGIWIDKAPEDIIINPDAVPDDCEAAILQKAARQLSSMGLHVNPKMLIQPEDAAEETEEVVGPVKKIKEPEEPPQLPIKSLVSKYKRGELETLIKRFGWDIEVENFNAEELKKLVRDKIEELSA